LAVVDVGRFHVENLFMSCRVQHKKVDHAFFGWLIRRAQRRGKEVVSTVFRFSGRNDAARQALAEMNFSPANAVDVYVSPRLDGLPERDIVKVIDETERSAELTAAEAC
jgi:predicted enzyme involved in methoxymalonyl-ACP biosynthesis